MLSPDFRILSPDFADFPVGKALPKYPKQTIQMFTGGMELSDEQLAPMIDAFKNFFANPIRDASANCNLSDVISPDETRRYLIRSFEMLKGKKRMRIPRKHGNIPL